MDEVLEYPFLFFKLISFDDLDEEDREYNMWEYEDTHLNLKTSLFVFDECLSMNSEEEYPYLDFLGIRNVFDRVYEEHGYVYVYKELPAYKVGNLDGEYVAIPVTDGR